MSCTPPDILASATENLLPMYFVELAKIYKSSSLWAYYSMLKSTLNIYHSIHLETYMKIQAFLKRQSEGHQPKKSKTFTPEEISKFIKEAPDHTYLMTKVTLIMGLMEACRSNEFYSMKTEDIEDYNGALIMKIPFTKTIIPRFVSGHSFRRSSATICVSAGGDITAVKQLGGWKSTTVAEGYIDDNITNKIKRGNQISNGINKHYTSSNYNEKPCTSSSASPSPTIFNQTLMTDKVIPGMNFNNCNVTINN